MMKMNFSLQRQDLSLLVDLKYEDIQKLQAVGAQAQAEQAKNVLRNDLPKVWDLLKGVKGGRLDFVLDNGESDFPGAQRCKAQNSGQLLISM